MREGNNGTMLLLIPELPQGRNVPAIRRKACPKRALFTHHGWGGASLLNDAFELAHDPRGGKRGVRHQVSRRSLVQSATKVRMRMRKRRPLTSVCMTKSSDQSRFQSCGIAIGALVPRARLRPSRLSTVNRFLVKPVELLRAELAALALQHQAETPIMTSIVEPAPGAASKLPDRGTGPSRR